MRFVQLDLEILRQRYEVTEVYLKSWRVNPISLWEEVAAHHVVFGWFASWHAFLALLFARVLGRPSLLLIGGYDVAKMPEIGYGHQRGGLKKLVSRCDMRLATCLVTNARFSQNEAERNAGIPRERVHMIYHGLPDPFGSLPASPRAGMALTVGNVERPNIVRKGHEAFVRAAAYVPELEFVLVGNWKDDAIEYLKAIATPNVTFTGWVDNGRLLDYYRRASVYVQASAHEGFGLSVAEAMLAGCIPVVTPAGALPEVVGDAGLYLNSADPTYVAERIRAAHAMSERDRLFARERILNLFPMNKRAQMMERVIDGLVKQ
jgi:glycosyltransferase involved in cell wall biosynthesis